MNSKLLIKLIRKIVREEVQRVAKPLINEFLAEQFIKAAVEKRPSALNEVFEMPEPVRPKPSTKPKQEIRKELLKKLGVENNPMAALIYDDDVLSQSQKTPSANAPNLPEGAYVDDDDEGIDLGTIARLSGKE